MMKYKILLLMLLFSGVASGYDFYVSLSGSDENPGTESKPVCSLAGVQGRIEKLMQSSGYPAEGITVWIEPGHYAYEKTLILGPAISNWVGSPPRHVAQCTLLRLKIPNFGRSFPRRQPS